MSIRVNINTSSFALVADELNNTVQQATNVFESFLAERHGLHLLEECERSLRQIGGTLRLIEVRGAALLADEMRSLCQTIVGNTDALPDSQLNALSTAFFVLPRYLEFVQSQGADIPLLALGHANDLRAAHQQLLLPDSYFTRDDGWLFSRDSNLRLRNEPLEGEALQDIYKRTRHMYQRGLLGLLKGGQEELQLMMMTRALQRLCRHIPPGPGQRFWLLANGILEAFSREGLKITAQRRRVLASLEGQLRAAVLGRFNLNEVLEKELIFLLSLSSYKDGFTGRIQHAAKIRSADLDDADLTRLQQQMLGLSYDTVSSVLGELRIELRHAKDILELLAQHGRSDAEEIQPLSSLLQQCADVLLVLNLTGLAATLNEHVGILNNAIGSDLEQHRDDLENLAENLLFIESGLAQIDRRKLNYDELASLSFDQRDAVNTDNIVSEAKSLVVEEAKSVVALAKRALAAYIESGFDIMQITNLPSNFDAVRGAFALIGLSRLTAVLASSRDFMDAYLKRTEEGDDGDARAMETLADAMISIEYYLAELERRFIANDDILLVAEDSLQQLGYPVQRDASGDNTADVYGTA